MKQFKSKFASGVDAYIEEACIRRELSDNFCFYNPNYDNIKGCAVLPITFTFFLVALFGSTGAAGWAQETLQAHKYDALTANV